MANTESTAYLALRIGARGLLDRIGVPSNPAVGDEWIVNQLRRHANLPLVEGNENRSEDDFTIFQNSLMQIVKDLGGKLPEPDGRGSIIEARRLIYVLHGLFK